MIRVSYLRKKRKNVIDPRSVGPLHKLSVSAQDPVFRSPCANILPNKKQNVNGRGILSTSPNRSYPQHWTGSAVGKTHGRLCHAIPS